MKMSILKEIGIDNNFEPYFKKPTISFDEVTFITSNLEARIVRKKDLNRLTKKIKDDIYIVEPVKCPDKK